MKRYIVNNKIVCFILMIIALLLVTGVVSASTIAGTEIANRARLVYEDTGGRIYQVVSEETVIIVASITGVNITPGTIKSVDENYSAVFTHSIYNTGNDFDTLDISIDIPDDWDARLFIDDNNNGVFDEGERHLIDTDGDGLIDTGLLDPGQSLPLAIKINLPDSISSNYRKEFNLEVISSLNQNTRENKTNTIITSDYYPYIKINNAPNSSPAGVNYTYDIDYGNRGTNEIKDPVIIVPVPAGVDYISSTGDGVYDSEKREVVWNIDNLTPGESDTLSITVLAKIPDSTIANKAVLSIADGIEVEDTVLTYITSPEPYNMTIDVNPRIIIGDGSSTSLFTVRVYDIYGEPVEDGTPVTFTTESGVFNNSGTRILLTNTENGMALATLISPDLSGSTEIKNKVKVIAGTPEIGSVADYVYITFTPGGIAGHVFDHENNFPIAGLEVELINNNNEIIYSDYTDYDGSYLLPAPETGNFKIIVKLSGGKELETSAQVNSLNGKLTYNASVIAGKIIDKESNTGISSAVVKLYDYNNQQNLITETTAGVDGNYVLTDINPADLPSKYLLVVDIPGSETDIISQVEINEKGRLLINKNLYYYKPAIVYDSVTNEAVSRAKVTLLEAGGSNYLEPVEIITENGERANPLFSNSDGGYIFTNLEPGSYLIKVEKAGYYTYLSSPIITRDNHLSIDIPLQPLDARGINLEKRVDKEIIRPGEEITYELEFTNTSGTVMEEVQLLDELPDGIVVDTSSISNNGIYNNENSTITWNFTDINIDKNYTVSYNSVVSDMGDGTEVKNSAWVTDFADGFDYSSAISTVIRKPDIYLSNNVNKHLAKTGDIVTYTVVIRNTVKDGAVYNIINPELVVQLPSGFKYIEESAILNGNNLNDPEVTDILTWELNNLQSGEEYKISYKALIETGAEETDGINSAYLYGQTVSGYNYEEGPVKVKTEIEKGYFADNSSLIGRVYLDYDSNGIQNNCEPGLNNIEILLDNGTVITTDSNGDYTLPIIEPGYYTLSLSSHSISRIMLDLKKEGKVLKDGFRHGREVRVISSQVNRLDFPLPVMKDCRGKAAIEMKLLTPEDINGKLLDCYYPVLEIKNNGNLNPGQLELYLFTASSAEAKYDLRFMDEQKINNINCLSPGKTLKIPLKLKKTDNSCGPLPVSLLLGAAIYSRDNNSNISIVNLINDTARTIVIKEETGDVSKGNKIIYPQDGTITEHDRVKIDIQADLQEKIVLGVNGSTIKECNVGKIEKNSKTGLKNKTYINVALKPGLNNINLFSTHGEDKILDDCSRVYVTGRPYSIKAAMPDIAIKPGLSLDLPVYLLITDRNKLPVANYYIRDMKVDNKEFENLQVVDRGMVRIEANPKKSNNNLYFNVINNKQNFTVNKELTVDKQTLEDKAITLEFSTHLQEPFSYKTSLQGILRRYSDDSKLTVSYDNFKEGLYGENDQQPVYAEFGDSSKVNFDYKSSRNLYAYYENNNNTYLIGDFPTAFDDININSLPGNVYGIKANLNKGKDNGQETTLFITSLDKKYMSEELPVKNLGRYYFLSELPLIPGSEEIRIKSYGKENQSGKKLYRHIDYEINYKSGVIRLNDTIPLYDHGGNKQLLLINYYSKDDSSELITLGTRFKWDISGKNYIGVSLLHNTPPYGEGPDVYGIDGKFNIFKNGVINYEIAANSDNLTSVASNINFSYDPESRIKFAYDYSVSRGDFIAPDKELPQNNFSEDKYQIDYNIKPDLNLIFKSSNYNDITRDTVENKKIIELEHSSSDIQKESLGIKMIKNKDETGSESKSMILASRFVYPLSDKLRMDISRNMVIDNEDAINNMFPENHLSFKYDYSDSNSFNLAYRSNILDESQNYWDLSWENKLSDELSIYSSYRYPNQEISGKEALTLGFINSKKIIKGLNLNLSGETVQAWSDNNENKNNYSLAGGIDIFRKGIKGDIKHEISHYDGEDMQVTNIDLYSNINKNLDFRVEYGKYKGIDIIRDGLPLQEKLKLSLAYRPKWENKLLSFLEFKKEDYFRSSDELFAEESSILQLIKGDILYNVNKNLDLSARYGYKIIKSISMDNEYTSNQQLAQARLSYKLTNDLILDMFNRYLVGNNADKNGYSIQLRKEFNNNFNLNLGYNSTDLLETDFNESKSWENGWYMQLLYSIY